MRNLKKFLALVLAMIMVVGATGMVSADFTDVDAEGKYAAAINDLAVKGIIKGVTETTFGPEQDVKRWQMALFVARATTGAVESDDMWANGIVPFVDVVNYKGAIQHAYLHGIINGMTADTFEPEAGITYIQALKMAVCALGYGTDSENNALSWPWGYYNKAVELSLTDNLDTITDFDKALTREETAQVIYNLLYADPADGSLCLAAKYFNIATADNTNVYVVTATPKQFHGIGANDAYVPSVSDKDVVYVGVQLLKADVPVGEIYYIPAAVLGIADEDVEDYFFRSVELINFDAETGEVGNFDWGAEPVTVTNGDVTVSGTKLTVDGITYTTTDGASNATLINELALFDGNNLDAGLTTLITSRASAVDSRVYVLDVDGNRVAYVLNDVPGATAAYYYEIATGKVLDYTTALAKYGVSISHGAIAASQLTNKAYALDLYDDDRDGKFDRAVYNPTFIGVYNTYKMANKTYDGLVKDLAGVVPGVNGVVLADDVTYTNADAKKTGTVMVYSYNPQLNEVEVIEILTAKTGTLEKIESTGGQFEHAAGKTASTAVKVVLTIDAANYQLYYFNPKANFWTAGEAYSNSVLPSTLGAYVVEHAPVGTKANIKVADVAKQGYFFHYDWNNYTMASFVNRAFIGQKVEFYEYNGYIFMADVVERNFLDDFAIIDYPYDFDYEGVYFDIYTGGKLVELAKITVVDGIYIPSFSGYNFDYAAFLANRGLSYPGTIYYSENGVVTFGNYQLNKRLVTDADFVAAGLKPVTAANATTLTFANGYTADATAGQAFFTNKDTIWYLIEDAAADPATGVVDKMKTTVTQIVGGAANNSITFDADTKVWVNSYGYAEVVFVLQPADHTFTRALNSDTIVNITSLTRWTNYSWTATQLGLPSTYTGTFYAYECEGVSLEDGAEITKVYSRTLLPGAGIYTIDRFGVVTGAPAAGTLASYDGAKYDLSLFNIQDVATENGYVVYSNTAPDGIINIYDLEAYQNGLAVNTNNYAWTGSAGWVVTPVSGSTALPIASFNEGLLAMPGFVTDKVADATYNGVFTLDFAADNANDIAATQGVTKVIAIDENGNIALNDDAAVALNIASEITVLADPAYLYDGVVVVLYTAWNNESNHFAGCTCTGAVVSDLMNNLTTAQSNLNTLLATKDQTTAAGILAKAQVTAFNAKVTACATAYAAIASAADEVAVIHTIQDLTAECAALNTVVNALA